MRKPLLNAGAIMASALALSLAGCSSEAPDEGILTETELGNVDVQEGTIGDDMIQPDALSEAATNEAEEAAAEEEAQAEADAEMPESEDGLEDQGTNEDEQEGGE